MRDRGRDGHGRFFATLGPAPPGAEIFVNGVVVSRSQYEAKQCASRGVWGGPLCG